MGKSAFFSGGHGRIGKYFTASSKQALGIDCSSGKRINHTHIYVTMHYDAFRFPLKMWLINTIQVPV